MLWKKLSLHISLKYKFIAVFLVFITLPTIFIGMFIYYQMNQLLQEETVKSTESIVDKIEGNLNNVIQDAQNVSLYTIYNDDFRSFMMTPSEKVSTPDFQMSSANIRGYLTFQLMSKNYIESFMLKGVNGEKLEMGTGVSGNESKEDRLMEEKKGAIYWSDPYTLIEPSKGKVAVISLSRQINDYNNIDKPIGYVRIRLDVNKLKQMIRISSLSRGGTVFLLGESGNIVIRGDSKNNISDDKLEKIKDKFKNLDHPYINLTINGEKYVAVSRKMNDVNWNLVAMVNKQDVSKSLLNIKKSMRNLIILLISLGLIALVWYYFSHIRRLIDLTETTRQVENQNFTAKVKVTARDEIGRLGLRFNNMVETIQNLIDKEYKLKIQQKESELKALQNQIDPHFLYNTLDMIRWQARLEKAKETSRLIELLSKVFRNSLKSGSMINKMEDELAFISSYLDLHKRRIRNTLHVQVMMDEQISKAIILKQILQPLVENSFKHGFKALRETKSITIRCYKENDQLRVDVIDNGKGIDLETFRYNISKNSGHALKNIQDRILLAFGKPYGLELNQEWEQGTWIIVRLPLFYKKSDLEELNHVLGETTDDENVDR